MENDIDKKTFLSNSISDHFEVWQQELASDFDRDFLLHGIQYGFRISDVTDFSSVKNVSCGNHPSINRFHALVEKELKHQIDEGNYKYAHDKPTIISPLGAIPKEGQNDVRLIHDCSRPVGDALNDYSVPTSVHYESIDNAFKLAGPNMYMCKIDLKSAYRSVAIHPDDYCMTGLQFKFTNDQFVTTLFDVRLPFGSSKGPMIFHRLSQSVKRMMARRGYSNIVVYLDDFLCVNDSYEKCCETQLVLMSLLIKLGFQVSWKKVIGPSQCVEFLGVMIDTSTCTVSLSDQKLGNLYEKLQSFQVKRRATKRQLQSLAGSLNWACQVICGGRFFLRRILDSINKLKHASHKCKLSVEFMKDIQWWLKYLYSFNGSVYYREVRKVVIHTDACNEGAGMFVNGQWRYVNWKRDIPQAENLHINNKEVLAAVVSVKHWAETIRGCDVTIITDSTVAKAVINKGRCKSSYIMGWLRHMFWITMKFNLKVRAIHWPGCLNQMPDAISRLHEDGQILRLHSLLRHWFHGNNNLSFLEMCRLSMSHHAFQVVHPQLNKWHYRLL